MYTWMAFVLDTHLKQPGMVGMGPITRHPKILSIRFYEINQVRGGGKKSEDFFPPQKQKSGSIGVSRY